MNKFARIASDLNEISKALEDYGCTRIAGLIRQAADKIDLSDLSGSDFPSENENDREDALKADRYALIRELSEKLRKMSTQQLQELNNQADAI